MNAPASGRWTASTKREICIAIAKGKPLTDVLRENADLSLDELQGWLTAWALHGENGLKVTRCQALRPEGLRHVSEPLAAVLGQTIAPARPDASIPGGRPETAGGGETQGGRT